MMKIIVKITIESSVKAPIEKVWQYWTDPIHIQKWNNASEDWHTVKAENDLRAGGRFLSRMEAKDSSLGFNFSGKYDDVELHKYIAYTLDDNRKVTISFLDDGNKIKIIETFDPEDTHPTDMQKSGWQAILDHFKKYTETH